MNTNLIDINLYGPLADKYGSEHKFFVRSPREAINALEANYPGFRRDFLDCPFYGLIVDGDVRDDTMVPDVANSPVAKQIDFVPVIEGRFSALLVPLFTSAAIGMSVTAANILAGVISTALLVGISMLLTPKVKKATAEETTKDENYMFSGPENITEQGVPVPLIYGRCFVGSVVVSAGLEVAEGLGTTTTGNNWVWSRAAAAASARFMAADMQPIIYVPEPGPLPEDPIPPGRSPRWIPGNA